MQENFVPRTSNQKIESHGLQLVRQFFELRGFVLKEQSLRIKDDKGKKIFGLGEVDLYFVHPSKNLGLLVEVKARKSHATGDALIFEKQLQRLRRSRNYLQRKHPHIRMLLVLAYVQVTEAKLEFLWNP